MGGILRGRQSWESSISERVAVRSILPRRPNSCVVPLRCTGHLSSCPRGLQTAPPSVENTHPGEGGGRGSAREGGRKADQQRINCDQLLRERREGGKLIIEPGDS